MSACRAVQDSQGDRTLYVTVGDRDSLALSDDNRIRIRSQSLGDHVGKVLRLTDEGGVPDDNPFVGRADARPEIFTYGHRNPIGLAFHPDTGELWLSDIGPIGGDRLDILKAGQNYGWPLVSLGRHYTGNLVSSGIADRRASTYVALTSMVAHDGACASV